MSKPLGPGDRAIRRDACVTCAVCNRDHARMNSKFSECSHIDCPHRRKAWSERPTPAELNHNHPPRDREIDPQPLDRINFGAWARHKERL